MILNGLVMAADSGYYYYLPAAVAFLVHPFLCYQSPSYFHYSYSKVAIMLLEITIGFTTIAAADSVTDFKLPIVADSPFPDDSTQHSAVELLQD